MSLIDEALKRAEIEAARRDGLRGGTYPWVPEQTPRRRRRWMAVAIVALIAGAAAGGVWWLSRGSAGVAGPSARSQTKAAGSPSTVQSPKPGTEMETVEVAPPPGGMPAQPLVRERPEPKSSAETEAKTPAARDAGRRKAATGEARSVDAAEGRPGGPAESKQSARGPAEAKTYVGEYSVPGGGKIALEGIAYSETNPVALVNGKVLPLGAVVEEFTIVAIESERIELRGRGVTIFLAIK